MAVMVIYYLLPINIWRKLFLLIASYYFYSCFDLTMLPILVVITGIAFVYGIYLTKTNKRSKGVLMATIVVLLMPLLAFKYLDFLIDSTMDLLSLASLTMKMPDFELFLPTGISFYTFMAVGYVVDVYKGKMPVEKNLLDFALFIGFFPQIASGLIGRANQLIPQLKVTQPLLYSNLTAGRFQKSEYFQDASHLNDVGANEYSKEIVKVLKKKNSICPEIIRR